MYSQIKTLFTYAIILNILVSSCFSISKIEHSVTIYGRHSVNDQA